MENTFTINGKQCRVTLGRTWLAWCLQDSSQAGEFRVPAAEIISCWSCPKGSLKCCPRQEALTNNCPQNDGLTSDDCESRLSTLSATSSLSGSNSGRHYGATETNNESSRQSDSVANTDHESSSRPRPSPSSLNAHGEKLDDGSTCRPMDRPTGLPFSHCTHSRKLNTTPALAVEICERVLPSPLLRGCLRGDEERMVTAWKPRVLVLQHGATDTVRAWLMALWEVVAGSPSRPRHLLVIVNPNSGSLTSEKAYNSRVAPLFYRAAIRITFNMTTHSGHAEELAEKAAMEGDVDGVVAVGGDGTVAEVVAGLQKAAAHQLGLHVHDRNTALPKAGVALGVIPSGSSNVYATSCHGTADTATAVLQIIMGTCRNLHLGGLYAKEKLVHVSHGCVHIGYLAGTLETSDSLRHLGPNREIIGGVNEFLLNRYFECEIRYLADENVDDLLRLDGPECRANCLACQAPRNANANQSKEKWVEVKGVYNSVSLNLARGECRYSKYGNSPMCHVDNGYCDVALTPKVSRLCLLLRLFRLSSTKDHLTKVPMQAFRTSELHCRFVAQPQPMSCDGELRYYPEFVFKMHRDCQPVYGRGREPLSTLDLSTLTNCFK